MAFIRGVREAWSSVFGLVLTGTYVGIGALGHEAGFSVVWIMCSTVLVWAAPAQVILISMLAVGAARSEVALAVSLSGMRLLPMVISLLPLIRTSGTRTRALLLPAHFTAISMWMESLRLLPGVPCERRVAFCNGVGAGFVCLAQVGALLGFHVAEELPAAWRAGLLFLTPISFLASATRNARLGIDRLALGLGLVLAPVLAWRGIQLDLMWTGIMGGSAAYAIHRVSRARRGAP